MVSTPTRRRRPRVLPSLLFIVLVAVQAHALAQQRSQSQSQQTTRPDPLDATAPVPVVRYTSSFAQRPRIEGDTPADWREANETVARIGGWRAYAREAQQPESAAPVRPPRTSVQTPVQTPGPAPADAAGHTPAGHPAHKH
jgi:hypothetical protein